MSIIEEIKKDLPDNAMIDTISYEGSEIILYTKNKDFFKTGTYIIKKIVNKIKKRIEVRMDPKMIITPEVAEKTIRETVPKEAGVKDIYFEPDFSKLIIHAEKPGLVIGKGGETLRKIKETTLWTPQIKRACIIDSDIVKAIRKTIHMEATYRKKFLDKLGEKIYSEGKEVEWIRLTGLGGFREVGRSCLLLKTPQSRVLLDCGVSVSSISKPYPYFDVSEFDMSTLDAIILSHAHLDHCGAIPALYELGYKGPLYTTAPTRDLMSLLQLDYIDIGQREMKKAPYTSKGIKEAVKHSIALEYGDVTDITSDMRLTLQNASHILGSALIHLNIGEGLHNVLYTGDFKYGRTSLFDQASTDFARVETLITESTYGASGDIAPPREDSEKQLISVIERTIRNGGKVLIPAFAVGRAQEVMAILADSPLDCPIFLDGMVWDATAIHTVYPECLSKELQNRILHKSDNPFLSPKFRGIGSKKERESVFTENKPYVVIATSGMLVGGPAIEYLKLFAEDSKNCLVFVGYQAEGTLGSRIQKGWKEVPLNYNSNAQTETVKLNLQIETITGLSGHSDRKQLMDFVKALKTRPRKVIVNHGDQSKCIDLARGIHQQLHIETSAPKALETIRLR